MHFHVFYISDNKFRKIYLKCILIFRETEFGVFWLLDSCSVIEYCLNQSGIPAVITDECTQMHLDLFANYVILIAFIRLINMTIL